MPGGPEIKFDGYRVQVHVNKGRLTVFTRNGNWTRCFHRIADAFHLPIENGKGLMGG
jgi:bifunctional non-homologous end joining protein LigD